MHIQRMDVIYSKLKRLPNFTAICLGNVLYFSSADLKTDEVTGQPERSIVVFFFFSFNCQLQELYI